MDEGPKYFSLPLSGETFLEAILLRLYLRLLRASSEFSYKLIES